HARPKERAPLPRRAHRNERSACIEGLRRRAQVDRAGAAALAPNGVDVPRERRKGRRSRRHVPATYELHARSRRRPRRGAHDLVPENSLIARGRSKPGAHLEAAARVPRTGNVERTALPREVYTGARDETRVGAPRERRWKERNFVGRSNPHPREPQSG